MGTLMLLLASAAAGSVAGRLASATRGRAFALALTTSVVLAQAGSLTFTDIVPGGIESTAFLTLLLALPSWMGVALPASLPRRAGPGSPEAAPELLATVATVAIVIGSTYATHLALFSLRPLEGRHPMHGPGGYTYVPYYDLHTAEAYLSLLPALIAMLVTVAFPDARRGPRWRQAWYAGNALLVLGFLRVVFESWLSAKRALGIDVVACYG